MDDVQAAHLIGKVQRFGNSLKRLAMKWGQELSNTLSTGLQDLRDFLEAASSSDNTHDPDLYMTDEELFQSIASKRPVSPKTAGRVEQTQLVLHPEVMEGVLVVGVPGPVIDAEILDQDIS